MSSFRTAALLLYSSFAVALLLYSSFAVALLLYSSLAGAAVFCNVFFYPRAFAAVCVPAIRLVSLMFSEQVMREHYHT